MYKEELLTVESYRSKEDHVAFVMKIIAIAASIYGMCRSFSGWMFFTYFTKWILFYLCLQGLTGTAFEKMESVRRLQTAGIL